MFRLPTILLTMIVVSNYSPACSCYGPLNFCETLFDNNPDVAVLAVKKASLMHGMQIEILEVLKGTEMRQQVMVWGDNGALCRHYTSTWNVGDTVIFSLDLIGSHPVLPQEDSTDYLISVCGTYYLDYAGGQVNGAINGTDTVMSYIAFKDALSSCITVMEALRNPLSEILMYPNPAGEVVEIALPLPLSSNVQIRLYNLSGKEVLYADRISTPLSGDIKLQTATLPRGTYILRISAAKYTIAKKLNIL